jgi:hypothetical protein
VTTLPASGSFTVSNGSISASQSTVTVASGTLTASNGNITDLVTVTVKDGLGNPIQGVTVSLSATGTANLVQPSAPTDASGVATGTFSSTAAGTHTITATAGGVGITQQPTVTVNPTAAMSVVFSVGPSNVVSAVAISPAVQVAVRDTFNNPVTTATNSITVALFNNPGGGTLSGTLTQAASAGVATFSNLSIDKTGNGYTLAATSSGLTGAISGSFNVTPAAAAKLVFSGQPTNVTAAASITPAVAVTVQDAQGNTVTSSSASITVAIGTNPGGGTLSGTLTLAASSGIATFSNLSINKAGNGYTLTAASSGLTGATSSAFNVSPGPASKLAFTAQPTNVTAATSISPAVAVTVQDAQGNTVPTATNSIAVAIGTNPGGGILSGTTPVSASSGVATFSNLSINKAGTGYTLTASASGLTGATSSTFNVSAGPPSQIAVNGGNNQSATVNTAVGTAPSVLVTDAQGNAVAGVSVTFAVATGGGTVNPTTAVTTNASGIAQVTSWTLGTAAGSNTLTATSGSLSGSPVTFTATGTAGTATQIAANAGEGQTATAGTAVATPPSVIVKDQFNNPVSGVSVTFAVALGGGTVVPTTAISTDVNGIAQVTSWTLGATPGTNTLTATSGSLAGSPVTFTATGQ